MVKRDLLRQTSRETKEEKKNFEEMCEELDFCSEEVVSDPKLIWERHSFADRIKNFVCVKKITKKNFLRGKLPASQELHTKNPFFLSRGIRHSPRIRIKTEICRRIRTPKVVISATTNSKLDGRLSAEKSD